MPANVPISAAPIRFAEDFRRLVEAPIALTMPSTAAQMPSAGSASATVRHREIGLSLVLRRC